MLRLERTRDFCSEFFQHRGVPAWEFAGSWKTGRYRHELEPGFGHALMAQVVAHVFTVLRISAAVENRGHWWALHEAPSLSQFESLYGADHKRSRSNDRHLKSARDRRKSVRGENSGYSDLFVPILTRGEVAGVLVSGPFASERPTSSDILSRFKALSGRRGHPSDPVFAAYLAQSLSLLVLDEQQTRSFEKLLDCLAQLIAGEGLADEIANRADALRIELSKTRAVERTWEAVQSMLDDRSSQGWSSPQ
ncbi:MAG TPA: hypothetical protein VGP93_11320, partial [Polyangiaceae bacterium]|nr:hypothetical protein [Polyangiaceae bacterium]